MEVTLHDSRKLVRVLVIDDSSEYVEQLKVHAEMYHPAYKIECNFAENDQEARAAVTEWHPSVVLLDLHAPLASAIDVLQNISSQGTPVVATSELQSAEFSDTAMASGATAYIPKSHNPDDLDRLLETLASYSKVPDTAH